MDALLLHRNLRIERILSSARIESTHYQQAQDEWVVLIEGRALLDVEGETLELKRGDYLFLPGGTPHRVVEVSQGALWLAVHLYPDDRPGSDDAT